MEVTLDNNTLKLLLIEYNKKRKKAEEIADMHKQHLYEKYPELSQIDKKINSLAISTMKEIAQNGNNELITKLNTQIETLKKKKETILQSIGKESKYIQPNYECSKCCDTGYVTINNNTNMCHCLKQKIYDIEYNKSNMHALKKQNFDNFNILAYSTKIDSEKYKSDISPRENIELILKICHNFIDNFDDIDNKNLLFTGKTGLGKTFLSSCIANELLKKGKTVLYQTSSVMLDTVIDYHFRKI